MRNRRSAIRRILNRMAVVGSVVSLAGCGSVSTRPLTTEVTVAATKVAETSTAMNTTDSRSDPEAPAPTVPGKTDTRETEPALSDGSAPTLDRSKCESVSKLDAEWSQIGTSVEGRSIRARRFHQSGGARILWVGGIHGDEPEGRIATEQLPVALSTSKVLVDLVQIEDVNPDGRAAHNRSNANGVDLNRNFPTSNFDPTDKRYGGSPLSQPESVTLHDVVLSYGPDLIVVMHSWKGRTFINFDGPAGGFAKVWSDKSGMEVVDSGGLGRKTPGSLGTWAGIEQGIPILTVEFLNGIAPEQAWSKTKDAAVAVLETVKSRADKPSC